MIDSGLSWKDTVSMKERPRPLFLVRTRGSRIACSKMETGHAGY